MLNLSHKMNRQSGVTLVEALIGLALSMIVVTSMVGLMSNSLGSASKIIQMTQLSDDLRNTMSMVTRDMRRANYNANAYQCYANSDCGVDGTTNQSGIVTIDTDCLIYNLDRNQDGNGDTDGAGGFRRTGTPGFIEMWVGDETATDPTCGSSDSNWIALTDPDFVDITAFTITNNPITGSIIEEGGGVLNQTTNRIEVVISGELLLDRSITRTIQDNIKVRNDYIWRAP